MREYIPKILPYNMFPYSLLTASKSECTCGSLKALQSVGMILPRTRVRKALLRTGFFGHLAEQAEAMQDHPMAASSSGEEVD